MPRYLLSSPSGSKLLSPSGAYLILSDTPTATGNIRMTTRSGWGRTVITPGTGIGIIRIIPGSGIGLIRISKGA